MKVTIRGETYDSVAEAAEAHSVAEKTVYTALKLGREDFIGTRDKRMQVTVRGKTYKDAVTAARALGVSVSAVYSGLSRGRPDNIGRGPGPKENYRGGKPQPITLAGEEFPSLAAASRALGKRPQYVALVLSRGGKRAKENLLRLAMEYANSK